MKNRLKNCTLLQILSHIYHLIVDSFMLNGFCELYLVLYISLHVLINSFHFHGFQKPHPVFWIKGAFQLDELIKVIFHPSFIR